jgi:surface protein
MTYMFAVCNNFNQDISSWNVSNVADFNGFMYAKTFNDYNPDYLTNIYEFWSLQAVQPNIIIDFGTIKYTSAGIAGRQVLTTPPNLWTITDGGLI